MPTQAEFAPEPFADDVVVAETPVEAAAPETPALEEAEFIPQDDGADKEATSITAREDDGTNARCERRSLAQKVRHWFGRAA
jgi:hypothetical protein